MRVIEYKAGSKDPKHSVSSIARLKAKGKDTTPPCDGCTACCRSNYGITYTEGDDKSLFNEHGLLPREDGVCGFLIDDKCSVYENRPKVCRQFDCRLMTIAGVVPDPSPVADAVKEWDVSKFLKTKEDHTLMLSIRKETQDVLGKMFVQDRHAHQVAEKVFRSMRR